MDTAQPVALLTGDALVLERKSSLGETLANQPGVSASSFGPIASRPLIRGQGGLRIQTYTDGADTLDAAALSEDHAVTAEPLLAQQIEIVRGPAALLFGSSAAAGAVNVITSRLPLSRNADPFSGSIQLRGDTAADERGMAAAIQGQAGDVLQFYGDYHHMRASDLRVPDGRLANSAGENRGTSGGVGWVGERGALAVSISELRSLYGLPGEAHGHEDDAGVADESDHHAKDIRLSLKQQRVDIASELRLDSSADALRMRAARNEYGHAELEGDEIGTRYSQLGSELRVSLDRDGRWSIGAQWRELDFDAQGDEAFLPASRTTNLGAFVFAAFPLGALTLETGGRLEKQDIDVLRAAPLATVAPSSGAAPSKDYSAESASASLGLVWRVSDAWNATLQMTSTERHPTATELFAFGPHLAIQRFEIGDADLGVERGLTADFTLRRRSESGWHGSIGTFVANYDQFIAAIPTGDVEDELPVVQFSGIKARFTGVEFELGHDALMITKLGSLSVRVFGDYIRARDDEDKPLPQIPPARVGLETGVTSGPLRMSLEALWHDSQKDVAPLESITAGFTALNAEFTYRIDAGGAAMLWFARGVNLLNEEMRRHASPLKDVAPLAARHLAVGVRIKF